MVESTLDLDQLDHHMYVIKPEYDERLQSLADILTEVRDGLDEEHRNVGADLGLQLNKKLHLENSNNWGYCFRITKSVSRRIIYFNMSSRWLTVGRDRKDAKAIQNNRAYSELSTQKGGVFFTTPDLRDLSKRFADTTGQYQRMQSGLVKEVIGIACTVDLVTFECLTADIR